MAKKSHGHMSHPHRGPHNMGHDSMRTGVQHGGKHPHGVQHDHHRELTPLTEHTFGDDAAYEDEGSSHHLGNNQCAED